MKNYIYQNSLIGKKQLRHLLSWSFTKYDSIQACLLADELKYLGFKYATQSGISISIEDLKIPFVKNLMLEKANQEIQNAEKIYLKGKITKVERFQKIIDTWSLTSEALKDQIIYFFKNYDPLNSVYIMAFSGARGNLSQVRQLVGMRGLMSDPSGQIMNLPIKKNFREGLTITDYLMSGYGARKGIVDTALKTANSGYLTRRLIDVAQDIVIREKDCLTNHALLFTISNQNFSENNEIYTKMLGRVLNKSVFDPNTHDLIASKNSHITSVLIDKFRKNKLTKFYVRSPLTCNLYRALCQKCYGWDLANENLVDIGEAVGILAGQSIGEPGTQLTMRTFHTGGIFTSEAREQIISPLNGVIQFYKILKTVILRTNRGEDVLVTKNSGSLVLIPEDKTKNLIQIEVLRNTILFPKNNQYILKDTVIGEVINTNKQLKTEVKLIVSDQCGEIFIPRLKQKVNLLNSNKLIWILEGQLYSSPKNSFLNFYSDYKLNKHSYIFRTKLINHYKGFISFVKNKGNLSQQLVKTINKRYSLIQSELFKKTPKESIACYLLKLQNLNFFVKIQQKDSKNYAQISQNEKFATYITNSFKTLTGGVLYYDLNNLFKTTKRDQRIFYLYRSSREKKSVPLINYRTLFWLGEEIHKVECEQDILLVDDGDFISEGFELIPGLFSKTSGLVILEQKNNLIKTITIKLGVVYESKKFKDTIKKLYYPGEIIFPHITIKNLSFCEHIIGKTAEQLLIRPVEIYEFSYSNFISRNKSYNFKNPLFSDLKPKILYLYKSNQSIKTTNNLNLISNILTFKINKSIHHKISIELKNNKKKNTLDFQIIDQLSLSNYLSSQLKYKNIQSSLLIQKNQCVSNYMILGYLEAISSKALEIVKFKIKEQINKEIFLISNDNCVIVRKSDIPNKKLHDFVMSQSNLRQIGQIIIETSELCTLQKGKPFFFPNCRSETLTSATNLEYKLVPFSRIKLNCLTNRKVSLNYYNLFKLLVKRHSAFNQVVKVKTSLKTEFSKLFIKNNGKLFSSLIPQFFNKFSIVNTHSQLRFQDVLKPSINKLSYKKKFDRTLLIQISEMTSNKSKTAVSTNLNYQLTLLKFLEQPFLKSTKSVGLYSVTGDYFEYDVNSIFCKNTEFIEKNKTIGLLNLEKEITGDIVQGLPRIEEILEARKRNVIIKRIPTSKKKGLLAQKTNLDINFEFKKLATTIKENDKINPHKLLKVYFNYYGLAKYLLCDRTNSFKVTRLINNYEGSYKSFKKVQLFILNSVQSIYRSQGVTINDKHLEVIIKQMTTKVLITYEGDTPLLRREVLELYHIKYINQIIKTELKQVASYIPLLLGITKSALNNPSFISAASFQETTRVLTKAAIEGRIDWLRGLKENIIIGHLIPIGTGSQNYRNCFKKYFHKTQQTNKILDETKTTPSADLSYLS